MRRITAGEFEDVVPSWSADGGWIYFASDRSGEMQIWKVPLSDAEETAEPTQVTRSGGFAAFESGDGKFLYYAKGRDLDTSIWRMPLPEGPEETVVEKVPSGWGNWTLSEGAVYYLDRGSDGAAVPGWGVTRLDLETGSSSTVATIPGSAVRDGPGFSLSADGRWLLIVQVDLAGLDLMWAQLDY